MVKQDDAKKMGYGEFEVYNKLRKILRKKGAKSNQVYKKVKDVMKHGSGADTREPGFK